MNFDSIYAALLVRVGSSSDIFVVVIGVVLGVYLVERVRKLIGRR